MPARGYQGYVGFGTEGTYGTPVAPSRYVPFNSESLALAEERIVSASIRGFQPRVWAAGNRAVDGDIELDLLYQGQEWLWKYFFGTVTTTGLEAGGTGAYQHVFTPNATMYTGLSVEIGKDLFAHRFHGCKVESFALTAAVNDFLRSTFTIMGEDNGTTTVASPTYPTIIPIVFTEVGTFTMMGTSTNVAGFTLTGVNGLAPDRRFLGSKLRKEPIRNAFMEVTGELTLELEGTTLYNQFANGAEGSMQMKAAGATIIGTTAYTFQIDLPRIVFDGHAANIAGPEIIPLTIPIRAFYDTTNTLDMLKLTLIGSTATV